MILHIFWWPFYIHIWITLTPYSHSFRVKWWSMTWWRLEYFKTYVSENEYIYSIVMFLYAANVRRKSFFCVSQYSNDTLNKTFSSGYLGNCIKWTNDICSEQQLFQPEQIDNKTVCTVFSPSVERRTFSMLIYVAIFRWCLHFAALILRGRRSERDIHWHEIGQGHWFLTVLISVEIITGEWGQVRHLGEGFSRAI